MRDNGLQKTNKNGISIVKLSRKSYKNLRSYTKKITINNYSFTTLS